MIRNNAENWFGKVLAQLGDNRIHYLIAGVGGIHDTLRDLAEKLGIGTQVHLLGYRADIAQLYKAADICIFPSVREGLGLAALEGMAAGLPLIASDNRGTRDYAVDQDNAIVCKFNSPEEFSAAIRILADAPCRRGIMGKKNAQIAQRFSVSGINLRMMEFYNNLEIPKR